jgi:hypothetical protein
MDEGGELLVGAPCLFMMFLKQVIWTIYLFKSLRKDA